nr:hypothetical protein [Tanacetum cinerariifolium]
MATTIEQPVVLDEARVPSTQRDMLHICPRIPGQSFDELPFEEEILEFLRFLGHSAQIKTLTDVNINKIFQPWRSFGAVINKFLTGKSSGFDSFRLSQAQILWGLYHRRNIHYAFLIWEDFVYQVEHKNHKKSNEMYYPRFTKVIIHHFMSKDLSIPRRNKVNWHYVMDDMIFLTINVVSRHQNTQQYGVMLHIELTNDEIRNTKAYKEYYACATREAAPKPKANAKRKMSGSDTSITPPTAITTLTTTVVVAPRLTATAKGKQPAKAKSPSDPSEVSIDIYKLDYIVCTDSFCNGTMETTIEKQVALDEALVPSIQRLRIGRSNFRLPSDIQSKELWATTYVHQNSIRFKLDNKKHIVNLETFRDMLHICPRIPSQSFDELPFEEEILDFLRFLGHSAQIRTLTDVNINKLFQPWRSFRAVINKCLTGKSSGFDSFRRSRQKTHISQLGGSGTDEGTGSKPGVSDVPSDDSKEEISWNSLDDEDVDAQEKDRDDDEGDDKDESDDGEEDDDDDKDSDERDDDDDEEEEEEQIAKIDEQDDTERGRDDDKESKSDKESDDEETREEESFDPIPRTPKDS